MSHDTDNDGQFGHGMGNLKPSHDKRDASAELVTACHDIIGRELLPTATHIRFVTTLANFERTLPSHVAEKQTFHERMRELPPEPNAGGSADRVCQPQPGSEHQSAPCTPSTTPRSGEREPHLMPREDLEDEVLQLRRELADEKGRRQRWQKLADQRAIEVADLRTSAASATPFIQKLRKWANDWSKETGGMNEGDKGWMHAAREVRAMLDGCNAPAIVTHDPKVHVQAEQVLVEIALRDWLEDIAKLHVLPPTGDEGFRAGWKAGRNPSSDGGKQT